MAAGNETKACVGSHYFYVGNMFDRARQARFQVEDLREVAVVTVEYPRTLVAMQVGTP